MSAVRRCRGFTLVEMAVALFVLGIVATLAYRVMVRTQSTYRVHRDIVDANQNARLAMETVTSDLRQVSFRKDPTQPSIIYAGIDSVVFVADMYDSVPGAETVSLYLTPVEDSTTQNPSDRLVYRSVYDTSGAVVVQGPVAYGIADSGLTFLYFDRDGAQMGFPIVQPEHIGEIEVAVTAQTAHFEPRIGGYRDVTVTTIVYPRNLPFTPPMARPSSPGCGNLTSPNCESLTASWTRPTTNTDGSELKFNDISHFSVYFGTTLDSMNMDTRLARNIEVWTVKDLTAGESYYISVTVTSQAGVESDPCTKLGAVGASAPPAAPGSFSGSGGGSGITLTWLPVTQDTTGTPITAAVTYDIFRGTASGFVPSVGNQIAADVADTTYLDPVTDSCTTYYYRATAQACGVEGAASAEAAVTAIPGPSCPTSIQADEGTADGEILVTWSAPTTRVDGSPLNVADINGYRVFYSLTSGVYTDSVYVAGGSSNSVSLSGLLFCETYYTNVAAVDQCGNRGTVCVGLESAARTKAPCNAMVPQEPANLQIVPGDQKVDLSWTPNTFDCDLDGYRIYYGTSPGSYDGTAAAEGPSPVYAGAASVQIDSSRAEFSLTGLTPCVEYYVTVVSVDNCVPPNESTYPPEVSAIVDCGTCDLAKACVSEVAEGSSQERVRFQIGNEGTSGHTVEEIEVIWNSGAQLQEILDGATPVWSQDGSSGEGPAGLQSSPAFIDVDDFSVNSNEDFGNPREMVLVFNGSANGDVIEVNYHTGEGACTITLSPCGILFSDSFTEPDGPPAGWTPRTGTWEVKNNELRTSNKGRITPDAFGFGNSDYTAEARVRVKGSRSDRRGGIYVRYTDTGNYYLFRFYPRSSKLEFRKKVASGSLIKLAETYSVDVSGDGWRTYRVAAYGNTFRCWVDGAIVSWNGIGTVITDTDLSAGNISMYAWRVKNAYFDDVVVDPTCGCGGVVP